MTREDIVRELKKKQAGRTVQALADEVGVTRPYLHEVLAGNRPPAKKVLQYLGIVRERTVINTYKKAAK